MITQETLFGTPVVVPEPRSEQVPPAGTKPPVLVEPLGPCCKCGEPAMIASPSGNPQSIYCNKCGRCGGKTVKQTALGISVEICGKSVETFVLHPRMGIWVCPCLGG